MHYKEVLSKILVLNSSIYLYNRHTPWEVSIMKVSKLNLRKLRNLIYMLVTICPSIITGIVCNIINTQNTNTSTLQTLNTLANNLFTQISGTYTESINIFQLLSQSESFRTLDPVQMSNQINLLRLYNSSQYTNICVFDKDLNLVTGVSEFNAFEISSKVYIQDALKGFTGHLYMSDTNNKPILKTALPIFSDNKRVSVVGIIVATLNLDTLNEPLSNVRLFGDNVEAYLVDATGTLISDSRFIPNAIGKVHMDIDKIKLSIDYDASIPFTNYREKQSYGIYYSLPDWNWTLLVTNEDIGLQDNTMNTVGYVSGLLGMGTITSAEAIRNLKNRKKSLEDLIETLENTEEDDDASNKSASDHQDTSSSNHTSSK